MPSPQSSASSSTTGSTPSSSVTSRTPSTNASSVDLAGLAQGNRRLSVVDKASPSSTLSGLGGLKLQGVTTPDGMSALALAPGTRRPPTITFTNASQKMSLIVTPVLEAHQYDKDKVGLTSTQVWSLGKGTSKADVDSSKEAKDLFAYASERLAWKSEIDTLERVISNNYIDTAQRLLHARAAKIGKDPKAWLGLKGWSVKVTDGEADSTASSC